MKDIHKIQMAILRKLLLSNGLRYNQAKPDNMIENNQYDYHLDKLIDEKLIEKNE